MPSFSEEPASLLSFTLLQRGRKHALEQFFGTLVLKPVISHEPPDDPAAEAECVEALGRVFVKRFCVGERVDGRRTHG